MLLDLNIAPVCPVYDQRCYIHRVYRIVYYKPCVRRCNTFRSVELHRLNKRLAPSLPEPEKSSKRSDGRQYCHIVLLHYICRSCFFVSLAEIAFLKRKRYCKSLIWLKLCAEFSCYYISINAVFYSLTVLASLSAIGEVELFTVKC